MPTSPWKSPSLPPPLMDVWFLDQNRGWAVGAFGTLLTTDDGGQHWVGQPALVDNPDEFHLNSITGDGANRVFIAGEGGLMYRSLGWRRQLGGPRTVLRGQLVRPGLQCATRRTAGVRAAGQPVSLKRFWRHLGSRA